MGKVKSYCSSSFSQEALAGVGKVNIEMTLTLLFEYICFVMVSLLSFLLKQKSIHGALHSRTWEELDGHCVEDRNWNSKE